MTEVRRDGKDDKLISAVIKEEFDRRMALPDKNKTKLVKRHSIHIYIRAVSSYQLLSTLLIQFKLGSIHIWRQMFFGFFWPT